MTLAYTTSAYDQFLEYLAEKVSPADILAFTASQEAQEKMETLTEKNKAGTLAPDEAAELDALLALSRLMTLLKTKAYIALQQK